MEKITTGRLTIRRFTAEDRRDLYEYLSDPEVVKFEPYEPLSEEECRREAARRAADPDFWAVCLSLGGGETEECGKLIGNLYFTRRQPAEWQTWEIGYVFNAAYQGKGYAAESCRALLGHAFSNLHARRVVAMCDPRNTRSWRLLERLGMRREGHLREDGFFKRDKEGDPMWHDTYEYALLEREWSR